jgi:hypothetical protein
MALQIGMARRRNGVGLTIYSLLKGRFHWRIPSGDVTRAKDPVFFWFPFGLGLFLDGRALLTAVGLLRLRI